MSKSKSTGTTKAVVRRVQSAVATKNRGKTPSGSYVGRMQRVVAQAQTKSSSKAK